MNKFKIKFDNKTEEEVKFFLSEEGILECKLLNHYYVDTLMEDAKEYLKGYRELCVYGGNRFEKSVSTTNIKELIEFILKNRFEIELQLRGGFKKNEEL